MSIMTTDPTSASASTQIPSGNGDELNPQGPGPRKLGVKEQKEILSWAEAEFRKCKTAREPFERQWYLNIAFYFGRQYVQWTPTTTQGTAKLYEPAAPQWRVRLISNKIRPLIRNELTKVTKELPQGFVRPDGTEDEDIAAADAAERIVEYEQDELRYNKVLRRGSLWMLLCGSGFFKDYYDDQFDNGPDQPPGKICLEPFSPFHMFAPVVQQEEIEDQPYVIHAMSKTPEWVMDNFGVEVEGDSGWHSSLLESRFLNALGAGQTQVQKTVLVKEMWVKPCGKFPNGAKLTWCSQTVLDLYDGWPFLHKQYPFSKIDHIPTGRFWGDSVIVDLIPLQREYNRTRSQIIESKNRMAKPQLIAPRGSIQPSRVTSEPGLIIEYTPGLNPPSPLQMQNLPTYVIQELDRIQKDMDEISSQYEIAKGRTPPGVTAASAIAYLQEENDSKLATTTTSIEEATEKIGQHILWYVQQYWDEARKIKVLGEDNTWESFEFSQADIAGNTDFRVEAGSSAPRSRAAKQALLTELGKLGWIPPDKVLRYMGLVETGRMYKEAKVDERQVMRENNRMMQMTPPVDPMTGQPIINPMAMPGMPSPMPQLPVNDFDNDAVHIVGHENFMKSQRYEAMDPQVQQVFLQHLAMHKQRYQAMQMQAAMAQQGPPQGGPPPGGPQ